MKTKFYHTHIMLTPCSYQIHSYNKDFSTFFAAIIKTFQLFFKLFFNFFHSYNNILLIRSFNKIFKLILYQIRNLIFKLENLKHKQTCQFFLKSIKYLTGPRFSFLPACPSFRGSVFFSTCQILSK